MHPWVPMKKAIDLKHLGKLQEELAECLAATARCLIQGIDEREPVTGKLNREWLEDEIADVFANLHLVRQHFGLNFERMNERAAEKMERLSQWHQMLAE